MTAPYFDSHAHLTTLQLCEQADTLVQRAQQVGVQHITNICTDISSLEAGLLLAKRCPMVVNAAATTPHDVEREGELVFPTMAAAARSGDLVAVGETGLDYFYEHSNRAVQKQFLIRYLHLATACKLPVIIHCRDAFADFFEIFDTEYRGPGVLHCFTGTLDEAKSVVDRGMYLSLSGIVTYKKSDALREVARYVPLDRLLIETDAPYLAPQSRRGQVNEPAFVTETCAVIATAKGIEPAAVAAATYANACQLFLNFNAKTQRTQRGP